MARSLRAAYDVYVCAVLCVLFPLCTPEKKNERKKHGQKRRGRRAACQRNNANFITSTYFPIFIIVRISKQLKIEPWHQGLIVVPLSKSNNVSCVPCAVVCCWVVF